MAKALLRVTVVKVRDGSVRRHAIVPQSNRSLLPLDTDLEVLAEGNVLFILIEVLATRDDTRREVYRGYDAYIEQQLQESVRFLVLEANDALREALVHKQGLFARHLCAHVSIENFIVTSCTHVTYWMDPHDRVLRLHRLATNMPSITSGILCLVVTAVLSAQTLEEGLNGL
jgi:hypothetical protein